MKKSVRAHLFSILFLSVYLTYLAGSTLFCHTHVVAGVSVVHSHFYTPEKGEASQKPTHNHTKAEFYLICYLDYHSDKACVTPFEFKPSLFTENHPVRPYFICTGYDNIECRAASLRAPPSGLFS